MKKNVKRIWSLLLVFMMVLSLAACGGDKQKTDTTDKTSTDTEATTEDTTENTTAEETTGWIPAKPIHIVNQSEAGSGTDLFVRTLQPWLQQELGVAIVCDSAPGSGGKIAATQLWNANPDGYALLAHSSPLTTVTEISKDCEYHIPDFEHIISFDVTPYAIGVKKGSDIESIDDLIAATRTRKVSNANSGLGGAQYLQSMIMKDALGIEYDEVPYNGSAPCGLAVMNGDTTITVVAIDTLLNNSEEIEVLAVLADERYEAAPDVPTIKELGYDFPCLTMRRGIVAPPGTPPEVVDRLIEAFAVAVETPEFQEYAANTKVMLDIKLGDEYQAINQEYYDTVMQYVDYLR